jgi:catechol 2,3-dioxygenase-like lactoylglutathione lyase family enzyme
MQLFHYHLVTSRVREVEARYLAKLGFNLIARYGRIEDEHRGYESGVSWEELDRVGFKLRLSELERGAVNVVVQPGQWDTPRVDHLGVVLDDEAFSDALGRADALRLRIQEHGARRTFVATGAGFRVELHPPREWIDALLAGGTDLSLAELHLKADSPRDKAAALGVLLDASVDNGSVTIGDTVVRFVQGGPQGRPELYAELFV